MRAAVFHSYGEPENITIEEVPIPEPKATQIRIRVIASAIHSADIRIRRADPFLVRFAFGLFKPRTGRLGIVYSGVVEKCPEQVTVFKEGDNVFGLCDFSPGAHAEYICVPENSAIARKPENLSHAETVSLPFGFHTALHFFKKIDVQSHKTILIIGAAGNVGIAAVQLARYHGLHITTVSALHAQSKLRQLGAEKTLTVTEFKERSEFEIYDIVLDTSDKYAYSDLVKMTRADGTLILVAGIISALLLAIWHKFRRKVTILAGPASAAAQDIDFIRELAETGQIKPDVYRTFSLREIVNAHKLAESRNKLGVVVIEI
ncbi:MAG: NAD(P)-dependent alcohol dehydrogenase [Leptospiraceae bacterium]|nr:NAD(P)-dependent alcohol dehydrogenase [Leptospiraceae bacterium]